MAVRVRDDERHRPRQQRGERVARARPELSDQLAHRQRGEEHHRRRLAGRAPLELVDAARRGGVERVAGEPVDGVGGKDRDAARRDAALERRARRVGAVALDRDRLAHRAPTTTRSIPARSRRASTRPKPGARRRGPRPRRPGRRRPRARSRAQSGGAASRPRIASSPSAPATRALARLVVRDLGRQRPPTRPRARRAGWRRRGRSGAPGPRRRRGTTRAPPSPRRAALSRASSSAPARRRSRRPRPREARRRSPARRRRCRSPRRGRSPGWRSSGDLDEQLGLGPRDQHAAVNGELEVAKPAAPDACRRPARAAARRRTIAANARAARRVERGVGLGGDPRAVPARRLGEQQLGVEARRLDARGARARRRRRASASRTGVVATATRPTRPPPAPPGAGGAPRR